MSRFSSLQEELANLYYDRSKHSVYQTLPKFVEEALGFNFSIDQQWRGDEVRMAYLSDLIDWSDKRVVDIGANTGYFSLNLARHHGCRAICYESNARHCRLIERIADYFAMQDICVVERSVGIREVGSMVEADVALLLNVLHHVGHDFDQTRVNSPSEVENYCIEYLARLRTRVSTLVLQMGYNWGGNKTTPIIAVSDTRKFFDYQRRILSLAGWRIARGGMAFRDAAGISYRDLDLSALTGDSAAALRIGAESRLVQNLSVQEGMSEFYRRPLLLCRAEYASSRADSPAASSPKS